LDAFEIEIQNISCPAWALLLKCKAALANKSALVVDATPVPMVDWH
jgi:hypothetical protein